MSEEWTEVEVSDKLREERYRYRWRFSGIVEVEVMVEDEDGVSWLPVHEDPFLAGMEAARQEIREKLLDRADNAIRYTLATISTNNGGAEHDHGPAGTWMEVHQGRAMSAHNQLTGLLRDLREILSPPDSETES